MSGIYLHKLLLTGVDKKDASVGFEKGANIISGPSNTGKTFIFECIEYMLGASSIERRIKESRGYQNIFLEIRTFSGSQFTIKSDFEGGDFYRFECSIEKITKHTDYSVLKRKHTPKKTDTLSYSILNECNFNGMQVRTNANGKKRELSLRDLRILHLIDELRVPTKASPFMSGQHIHKTVEENVLKLLLTGEDDSSILESIPEKILANKTGRLEVLNELIGIEKAKSHQSSSYEEILTQKEILNESLSENQKARDAILDDYRTQDKNKKTLVSEIQLLTTRHNELTKLNENTFVLEKQYRSDIKRLRSTIEVGETLTNFEEANCPVCESSLKEETKVSVVDISKSARSELSKLQGLVLELSKAKKLFADEIETLNSSMQEIKAKIKNINEALDDDLSIKNSTLSKLIDEQQEKLTDICLLIKDFENLSYLEGQKQKVEEVIENAPPKNRTFEKTPNIFMDELALSMEGLLEQWGYPDVGRVRYSEDNKDFLISGENRNLTGKGYRAITFSAFVLSLIKSTEYKEKCFGLCMIDSPLVTYRKPDVPSGEGISEDMANEFYKSLINVNQNCQVIIIENEEVPSEVENKINHIHFTKNPNIDRYGFIPRVV